MRHFKYLPKWMSEGRGYARELVRIRDNRTCQDCGKKWRSGMRRFDVHHLNGLCGKKSKGYDSPKDIGGLITYCHKCHLGNHVDKSKFRNKGGLPSAIDIKKAIFMKKKGKTLKEIGIFFGVSKQRIHQKLLTHTPK